MKIKIGILFIVFWGLLFSACAKHIPDGDLEPMPFDMWIEKKLVPYVVEKLDTHPMFKGQPILLVSLKGEDVQPEIDDLTSQIRTQIKDGLLAEPGISLVWRPAVKPWTHHRSLEDVACSEFQRVRFYVGIDVGLTKVNKDLYVKVRALNLDEKKWVSGFGLSWTGEPTKEQEAAIKRKNIDDHLRGLRPLPFEHNQPDLLAAYLSQNLSCLFRQKGLEEVIVYVDHKNFEREDFFGRSLSLVGSYLARFREVTVTDDPNRANVQVLTRALPIHDTLYQVWVSARYKEGKEYVPGAETEAYVSLKYPYNRQRTTEYKPGKSRQDRDVIAPPDPIYQSGFDVFFYGFPDIYRAKIYPVLEQAPGVRKIRRADDLCNNLPACLCYEVQSRGSIEGIAQHLHQNLRTSQALQFKMQRRGENQLHLYFDRGFE